MTSDDDRDGLVRMWNSSTVCLGDTMNDTIPMHPAWVNGFRVPLREACFRSEACMDPIAGVVNATGCLIPLANALCDTQGSLMDVPGFPRRLDDTWVRARPSISIMFTSIIPTMIVSLVCVLNN